MEQSRVKIAASQLVSNPLTAQHPLFVLGGIMKKTLILAATLLAGCTSIEPLRPDIAARVPPSRLDEIAYINGLRRAFDFDAQQRGCYDGRGLGYFRPTLEQGYQQHTKEQEEAPGQTCVSYRLAGTAEIQSYLEAGFGLTDLYCQRFFVIAQESAQKRRFQRSTGSTVGGLVNSVLGLASAGQTAVAISGAGFTALNSAYQNVEDAFLVAPELENVRKLVHAAQDDFRQKSFKTLPGSYPSARSIIERYAGLCSYSGMKQLVDDSVSSETKSLNDQASSNPSRQDPPPPAPEERPTEASVPVPVTPDR